MDDVMQRRQSQALIDHSRRLEDLESRERIIGDAYAPFLGLPRLRAFWPMSSLNNNNDAFDLSGQTRTLTRNGTVGLGIHNNQVAFVDADGATGYYARADETDLDITGGCCWGGWYQILTNTAASDGISGKYNVTGNQRSYGLFASGVNTIQAAVSSDGTNVGAAFASVDWNGGAALSLNTWYFIWARFTTSSELVIVVNDKYSTQLTVPAAIFNSTAAFEIARRNVAGGEANLRLGPQFLAAGGNAILTNTLMSWVFARTRPFFQVSPA